MLHLLYITAVMPQTNLIQRAMDTLLGMQQIYQSIISLTRPQICVDHAALNSPEQDSVKFIHRFPFFCIKAHNSLCSTQQDKMQ